jgi:endoglucanase
MATMMSHALKPPRTASRFAGLLWLGVCAVAACSDLDPTSLENLPTQPNPPGAPPASPPVTPVPPVAAPLPSAGNPFAGVHLYVEPSGYALSTAESWRASRPADAALMEQIGRTAQAVWFNGWHADVTSGVSTYVGAAAGAGALPVLVAYNIPQRDCGSYSAGGSSSGDAYLSWIRSFATGIGSRRAVVVLEPDALAGMDCLSAADRQRRTSLLAQAINILKSNPLTFVYLDAGHARWIGANEMATRLIASNVAKADGFSLNVSNYVWNNENVNYGVALSGLIGGKHFVIDTSRNGQGPTANSEWCNPGGRGLGVKPTASTGHPLVDALLWIKRPGESDGSCGGGPSAGAWWAEYALGLAQRATSALALN